MPHWRGTFRTKNLLKRLTKQVFADPLSPTDQNPESSDRGLKNSSLATEPSVRSKLPIVNHLLRAPIGASFPEIQEAGAPWHPFGDFSYAGKVTPGGERAAPVQTSRNIISFKPFQNIRVKFESPSYYSDKEKSRESNSLSLLLAVRGD